MEGSDDPLHVLITGDDPAKLDEAAKLIEDMLVVIDDEKTSTSRPNCASWPS